MRAGLIGMRHGGICVHAGVPRARAPGLSLSLSRFVSYPAVLPVCRGGTRRVIPATPGEAGREREMRDNDDDDDAAAAAGGVAIALPEVSAVLSYQYFYINPRCTRCATEHCPLRRTGGGVS